MTWRSRRAAYYTKHPKVCTVCTADRDVHLHHRTYVRAGNELDADLMPLCEYHHALLHEFHHQSGLSLTVATARFVTLHRRRLTA